MRLTTAHILAIMTLLLAATASGVGLFSVSANASVTVTNQYGDAVKLWGKGLYAHDSFFRAPIFRGTDLTMLFVSCPLLLFAIVSDIRKSVIKSKLLVASVMFVVVYYAADIAFGVAYNSL